MQTGVSQGCLLPPPPLSSPLPFLIALDWVTREAHGSSDEGLRWQLVGTLGDVEFLDDIALLTHRLPDIRFRMEFLKASVAYNFPITENKAEYLLFKCQVSIFIQI